MELIYLLSSHILLPYITVASSNVFAQIEQDVRLAALGRLILSDTVEHWEAE